MENSRDGSIYGWVSKAFCFRYSLMSNELGVLACLRLTRPKSSDSKFVPKVCRFQNKYSPKEVS